FLLATDRVLRVELPSCRLATAAPFDGEMTVITSVAWSGEALALTYHNGPEDMGFAILGREGWRNQPHHEFDAMKATEPHALSNTADLRDRWISMSVF